MLIYYNFKLDKYIYVKVSIVLQKWEIRAVLDT